MGLYNIAVGTPLEGRGEQSCAWTGFVWVPVGFNSPVRCCLKRERAEGEIWFSLEFIQARFQQLGPTVGKGRGGGEHGLSIAKHRQGLALGNRNHHHHHHHQVGTRG